PPGWNLNEIMNYKSVEIASYAYAQLTRFKESPDRGPTDFDWQPHLAQEVNQPDDTTVIFKLRPDAKFRPGGELGLNGRKVTSDDVKVAFELFSEKNANQLLQNRDIDTIETPDDETITFKLKRPQAPFIFYMNHHAGFYPIPRELAESDLNNTTTEGSENGPFMLKEFKVGQSELWERNPNYFDADKVYVDEVDMIIVPDPTTQTAGFREGGIDSTFWWFLPEPDIPSLQRDLPNAVFARFPNTVIGGVTMDMSSEVLGGVGDNPFLDKRVRQAVSRALDRDKMIQARGPSEGSQPRWHSAMSPLGDWWVDPKSRNAEYGEAGKNFLFDPQSARQMLEAAGYDFDKTWEMKVNAGFGPFEQAEAEVTQATLREAGIKVDLNILDNASWYSEVFIGKHRGGFGYNQILAAIEPDELFFLVYSNVGRSPIPGKAEVLENDATLKDLIDKQLRELNREARLPKVFDVQKYLADVMYMPPRIANPKTLGHREWVKNVRLLNSFNFSMHYNTWLDKA
ncbi:MAG: ABC transporter substrate-binding protein, partial [Dehalococcoidia bacterium]